MKHVKVGRGRRFYSLLVRLLPSDFRGDFGDAMRADAGAMPAARWWTREIPSVVAAIAREHLSGLFDDVRYSSRRLKSSPGFTAAAILMLAVGTGANTAMFSVIDAVLLRPAFPDAGRVVSLAEERPGRSPRALIPIAALPALSASPVFTAVAGVTGRVTMNERNGEVRRIDVDCVSAALFDVVGVYPAMGRVFTPNEDRAGAAPVVLIADAMWQRDFGGRPDVLGQSVTLGGRTSTIIGVMPRGFTGAFSLNGTEAWAPLGPAVSLDDSAACAEIGTTVMAVARIRPPATIASATSVLNAARPLDHTPRTNGGNGRLLLSRVDGLAYGEFRAPLLALMGTALCVLLIACANVANFQLERITGRRRELAVRLALGASRWRIVRQTLVENVMLSVAGAAAGCAIAQATLTAVVSLMPATLPHVGDIAIDPGVLFAVVAFAIGCGVAVGLVPALHMLRSPQGLDLRASERGVAGGARWTRRSLVVAEVAIAVTLLIGAGLMIRTLVALKPNELGFDTSHRTIARLALSGGLTGDITGPARISPDIEGLVSSLRRLPGVTHVSASSYVPMRGYPGVNRVTLGDKVVEVWSGAMSPEFLRDLGVKLKLGREFTAADTAASLPVAIVNESFAREFFGAADPVSQSVAVRVGGVTSPRQLVGVIRDTRSGGRDTLGRAEIYLPLAQSGGPPMLYFLLRTADRPDARLPSMIRAAVGAARPGQLVDVIESLDVTVGRAFSRPVFAVWLFGAFAGIALFLSALGLAAVMAWWVAQRRREIGVRIALGAPRASVAAMVAREALGLAAAGVAIGAACAYGGTRALAEWLYGVTPTDSLTFAATALVMLSIAGAAAWLPARRAARVDPAVTLRME